MWSVRASNFLVKMQNMLRLAYLAAAASNCELRFSSSQVQARTHVLSMQMEFPRAQTAMHER